MEIKAPGHKTSKSSTMDVKTSLKRKRAQSSTTVDDRTRLKRKRVQSSTMVDVRTRLKRKRVHSQLIEDVDIFGVLVGKARALLEDVSTSSPERKRRRLALEDYEEGFNKWYDRATKEMPQAEKLAETIELSRKKLVMFMRLTQQRESNVGSTLNKLRITQRTLQEAWGGLVNRVNTAEVENNEWKRNFAEDMKTHYDPVLGDVTLRALKWDNAQKNAKKNAKTTSNRSNHRSAASLKRKKRGRGKA